MNNLSKFPERLKDLMNEAGVNNSELGKNIGVEPSVISKFVRGERLPSATTLVALADFFKCTADYLTGRADILDERQFKPRPPFCEQINFLLKYYNTTKYMLEKQAKFAEITVNSWQRGKCEPTVYSLLRLAKHFDCSVDFILGREV